MKVLSLLLRNMGRRFSPRPFPPRLNESPELIAQEFGFHSAPSNSCQASMKVLSLLLRNLWQNRNPCRRGRGLNESPELIAQESAQELTQQAQFICLNESPELIAQECLINLIETGFWNASMKVLSLLLRNSTPLSQPKAAKLASMKVLSLLLRNLFRRQIGFWLAYCLNESPELIAQESRWFYAWCPFHARLNESPELIAQESTGACSVGCVRS